MTAYPAWLEGARVAPSTCNSQPWRFLPLANGDVAVGWDPARTLPALDPAARNLSLSLGAAIECAKLSSASAGVPLDFVTSDDAGMGVVGRLTPSREPLDRSDLRLAHALKERRTARTPHLRFLVPPVVLGALRRECVGWGSLLHIVSDRSTIRKLAVLAGRATAKRYADGAARADLVRWLRLQPDEPRYARDGLTAACLALPRPILAVARLATSEVAMKPLGSLTLGRLLALRLQWVMNHSAVVCLLTARSTDRSDMVRAGRLLLRLWLLGAEAGLSSHAVSAMIESKATVDGCLELFNAQGSVPASVFRLGFSPPVAQSPRLPPEQLLVEVGTEPAIGR